MRQGGTRDHARVGFTLVELLVVIGIIALLVSILLPALNRARKAANTVKCAAALREIGNAYSLYAVNNKGWWPPAKLWPISGVTYNMYDFTYDYDHPAYWWNFIGKYISNYQAGYAGSGSVKSATLARSTLIWGCTEWDGYTRAGLGPDGIANAQPGYGANYLPLNSPSNPDSSPSVVINQFGGSGPDGTFLPASKYKQPAERCLVCDNMFWLAWSTKVNGTDPTVALKTLPGQPFTDNTTLPAYNQQSTMDWYRHGTRPNLKFTAGGYVFNPNAGRIAYNILYCDGHVKTATSKIDAFSSLRMRFPG